MAHKNNFSLEDALQFCSKAKVDDSKNSAPRAAVYAGKIGKKSKRAIKIQAENSPSGSLNSASIFARKQNTSSVLEKVSSINIVVKVAFFLVITVALVCVFCYQPAKICYTQFRNTEKAAAELELVQARNEKLSANVASLKTDEGIEDKAKEDYGYVVKGEGAAHVSGIDSGNNSKLLEYVDSNKVTAPDTALTGVLDAIFGYDNSAK